MNDYNDGMGHSQLGRPDTPPAPPLRHVFNLPTWMYYFFWAFVWLLGFGLLAFATNNFGKTTTWGYVLYTICMAVAVIFAIIIGYGVGTSKQNLPNAGLAKHMVQGTRIWVLAWLIAFFVCELAVNTVASQYNFNPSGLGILNCILVNALVGLMYLTGSAIFADAPMLIVGLVLLLEVLIIPAFRVPRGYWITAVISGITLLAAGIVDYISQNRKAKASKTKKNAKSEASSQSRKRGFGLFKKKSSSSGKSESEGGAGTTGNSAGYGESEDYRDSRSSRGFQDSHQPAKSTAVTGNNEASTGPSSSGTRQPSSRTSNWS